jgi:hypothetical protein
MSYSALQQDTITRWTGPTDDGYGGQTYGTPSQLLGRWQNENVNQQDADGEEFVSSAVIYTTTQLNQNDWVYEGTSASANPQDQEGAYRVRLLYTTSTPNDSITVYKATLG